MIVCGVEEPLKANERLLALDERTGKVGLSRIANSRLSRYVFAWIDGADCAPPALAAVVRGVQRQLDPPATWVSAWTGRVGPAVVDATLRSGIAHRARVLAARRRKEGWAIQQAEGLYLGTKPVAELATSDLGYSSVDPRFGGRLLAFARMPPARDLLAGPAGPFLETLATHAKPAPSEAFLRWISGEGLSIGYFLIDERSRHYLVLVSPRLLRLDEMVVQGIVDRVWRGPDADRIWTTSSAGA